jgi:hypothetical protein
MNRKFFKTLTKGIVWYITAILMVATAAIYFSM